MSAAEEPSPQLTPRPTAASLERIAAAQDPNLPEPPPDAQTILRGSWNDLPSKKLLELVAFSNLGNWTGELDWFKRGTQLSKPLQAITTGFCDNIVLRRLVPPEHIKRTRENDKRSQEYTYFGETCKTIREILEQAGIKFKPDDVTGARIFAIAQQPKGSRTRRIPDPEHINSDTVPHRGADAPKVAANAWYWQHFKVSLADADLQQVIDLVRSGAFARHGLWLNDFDVTIDCKGVVDCQKLKHFLLSKGGFHLQGHKFTADDFEGDDDGMRFKKIILDNVHKVGLNCLSWTQHHHGMFCRVKVYIKLVQEFEKHSVRSSCGNHIGDWIEMTGTRLSAARDDTSEDGLTRSESTIYTDTEDIPIHKAHLYIPETAEAMTRFAELQIDVVPPSLVLKVPHRLSVAAWCANISHTLIVVDMFYDQALIAYAKNEITHTVSGTFVTGWNRRRKYIMQRLTMGVHPIDVIYLNRGSPHAPLQQAIPGETESDKKMRTTKKQRLNAMQKRRDDDDEAVVNWVDADADGDTQRSITDFLPSGSKRTMAEAEGTSVEDAAEDDAEEPDVDQEEPEADLEELAAELDAEAQVALALREERERAAAELAEAQAAAMVDTSSTIADDDCFRVAAPMGALVAYLRRYQRVASSATRAYSTEFPQGGHLAHYFKLPDGHPDAPQLISIDPNIASREELKQTRLENENLMIQSRRVVMERQLGLSGWRPTSQMNSIDVQPRVCNAPISNKIKDFYICEITENASMPKLDMQSVKGAQRRHSFTISVSTRRKRKEKLWKKRQAERLGCLQAAAAERTAIVQAKNNTITAVEFKKHLNESFKANRGGAASLYKIQPGSYPIVAARVRIVQKEDTARVLPGIELFLRTPQDDGSETTTVFRSVGVVDAAFDAHALSLAHLYNTLGDLDGDSQRHGTFYMDPQHNGTPIGTFERAVDCEKARNGRSQLNCGIVIGDITIKTTTEIEREEHAVQSEAMDSSAPPKLKVTDETKRSAEDMAIAFAVSKNDQPRAVRVLKMETTDYRKHKDKVILQVQEVQTDAAPVIVWGGPTLNHMVKSITRDCVIVIHGIKARNQMSVDIVEASDYDWTRKLPSDPTRIPVAKTGAAAAPTQIAIANVTHISINKVKQPVVLDTCGKAWRFDKPNVLKAIDLRDGLVLNTTDLSLSEPMQE